MVKIRTIISISGRYILASLGAFAFFGLLLAGTWSLPFGDSNCYQLITTIISTCLAIFTGGYLVGKMRSRNPVQHAAQWGLMIGFVAFGYLFGIDWKWLAALMIAGVLATLGGWVSRENKFIQKDI